MENSVVSCKLKIPTNLNEKTPAFLVDFTNASFNINSSNNLKFDCYRHKSDEVIIDSSARRLLCVCNSRIKYKGTTPNGSNYGENKMKYFVGVRNKITGKMRVYDSVSFRLKPVMKTAVESSIFDGRNNYKERINDLTAVFGSKSQKRIMTSHQKYASDALLDDTFEDMSIDEPQSETNYSVEIPKASTNIEYIPPQNGEAKCVEEVYKISDIISAEEDEYLIERADEFLQDIPTHFSHWKTDNVYCEYILKHLEKGIDTEKVKYLLYYNYLFLFSQLLSNNLRNRDPVPGTPEPIKSNLLECFTVLSPNSKNFRSFPLKMKDKLLAYMIVLALFIDDYCVNLTLLQHGTRYGTPKVTNVARALGCYVVSKKIDGKSVQFAELKLPLFILQKQPPKKRY